MKAAEVLPTENEAWGFWGAMQTNAQTDPTDAWVAASLAVVAELNVDPTAARNLLDSRFGRHLADQVWASDDVFESVSYLLSSGPWRLNALQAIRSMR